MLHTKFQEYRHTGSGEDVFFSIFEHGSHVKHATLIHEQTLFLPMHVGFKLNFIFIG